MRQPDHIPFPSQAVTLVCKESKGPSFQMLAILDHQRRFCGEGDMYGLFLEPCEQGLKMFPAVISFEEGAPGYLRFLVEWGGDCEILTFLDFAKRPLAVGQRIMRTDIDAGESHISCYEIVMLDTIIGPDNV